jgi:hypothetical protein
VDSVLPNSKFWQTKGSQQTQRQQELQRKKPFELALFDAVWLSNFLDGLCS